MSATELPEVAVVHRTRPPYLFAAALVTLVGLYFSWQVPLVWVRPAMLATFALASVLAGMFLNAFAPTTGTLSIQAQSVELDGRPIADKSAIRTALLAKDPAGARLYLDAHRFEPPIELILSSMEHGRAALAALGFDAEQRTMTLPLRLGRVTVGTDGVLVQRGLRREHIGTKDIASVSLEPFGATLALRDGSSRRLSMKHGDLFVTRVEQAVLGGSEAPLPDLARYARPVAQWIEDLRARLGVAESFRETPLTVAELFRVLESHLATPAERAVAAAVLSDRLDDAARARVRVVAETSASPKLRVALDATLAGDAAAIERALEEVADEENTTPAQT